MMKYSVVITTIYLPRILQDLADNIETYSRKNEVEVLVIGDVKTPPETAEFVAKFALRGFHFEYWDLQKQKQWLARFPELDRIIPTHSDNRRNVGYLMAYERGRECIIALDDDNFPTSEDYFAGHSHVGSIRELPVVRAENGWYNICDLLEIEDDHRVYPRGYPYKFRTSADPILHFYQSEGRVVVNAGLWLGDPDIDAVTRLNHPVNVTGIKKEIVALDRSTNCPFNTQNTAFHRDILPCYYYVMMGHSIGGLTIDRYGDIWSSYFSRKVIDRMGDTVTFGLPVTIHNRHAHDLMKDLGQEYWGMVLTNQLVDILEEISLSGTTYSDCYRDLSIKLEGSISRNEEIPAAASEFIRMICHNMRIWTDVCNTL